VAARIGIGPAFIAGCVLYPAPLFLVPAAGGGRDTVLALLFLAEFGSGIGVMMLDISAGSIFAAVIPDPVRARVSGAYRAVNYGARPLGSLAAAALGTAVGPRTTLVIAVAGALAGAGWLIPSPLPRMRTLPSPPPGDVRAAPASPAAEGRTP
jgi:hypothetical protein